MHSFRTVAVLGAMLLASTVLAEDAVVAPRDGLLTHDRRDAFAGAAHAPLKKMLRTRSGSRLDKEAYFELEKRAAGPTTVQDFITQLQSQTLTITQAVAQVIQASGSTPQATTNGQLNSQFSSLQTAINVAVGGITPLLPEIKNSLDLNNLGLSVAFIIFYVEYALNVVQSALQIDPALAPLILTLNGIIGGPLMSLLTTLQGAVGGLLPIVNALLASVGLAPVLAGVNGLLTGVLGGLGI
ncbi:hypothetical protein RQP46_003896 [Phenoliferia psychrophenolica]